MEWLKLLLNHGTKAEFEGGRHAGRVEKINALGKLEVVEHRKILCSAKNF